MKSLKRICSELCYEKGYDPSLWPSDVYDDIRHEKFRKIVDTTEDPDNEDSFVGWME